jgi:hypothetical protein
MQPWTQPHESTSEHALCKDMRGFYWCTVPTKAACHAMEGARSLTAAAEWMKATKKPLRQRQGRTDFGCSFRKVERNISCQWCLQHQPCPMHGTFCGPPLSDSVPTVAATIAMKDVPITPRVCFCKPSPCGSPSAPQSPARDPEPLDEALFPQTLLNSSATSLFHRPFAVRMGLL